jgi:hypothetical protein
MKICNSFANFENGPNPSVKQKNQEIQLHSGVDNEAIIQRNKKIQQQSGTDNREVIHGWWSPWMLVWLEALKEM